MDCRFKASAFHLLNFIPLNNKTRLDYNVVNYNPIFVDAIRDEGRDLEMYTSKDNQIQL